MLISRADALLSETVSGDEFISGLESYAIEFGEWFAANEQLIAAGSGSLDRDRLRELAEKHEAVLHKTELMQKSFPEAMKELRNRGRGIMAYTDLMPKKISLNKPQKG